MSIENSEEGILATARKILTLGPICDNCLGRQFAMLSTGLTNAERGRSIKTVLAMQAASADDEALLEDACPQLSQRAAQAGPQGRRGCPVLGLSGGDEAGESRPMG